MNEHPPEWADALLRLVLARANRDCISGDLLEAYRDDIVPARGRRAADVWYVVQVFGYVWRATWVWTVIFSGACLARTGYDWLVPTTDFVTRSSVSTAIGVSTLMCVGFTATWRSGSALAGPAVAALVTQIAAVFSVIGAALMLGIWHDADTLRAIEASGGLAEVFILPFLMIIPAVALGWLGAGCWVLGALGCRVLGALHRSPLSRHD
jgi:hypothetical protein